MTVIPPEGYQAILTPEDQTELEQTRQERLDYLDELAIEEWKENRWHSN